jgi:hypothetical protein
MYETAKLMFGGFFMHCGRFALEALGPMQAGCCITATSPRFK